jgi:hypothetical protein
VHSRGFLGLKLGRSAYLGLGFYLAPYPPRRLPHNYRSCFLDPQAFLRLPYPKNSGSLLTAVAWQGGLLKLKNPGSQAIWCQPSTGDLIPELIFYKDLLEARKAYLGKTVWLKKTFFFTLNGRSNPIRYPLKPFTPLRVQSIELGPVSSHTSLRVHLHTAQGLPGYLDINFTGVNRTPPFRGLERVAYLQHPRRAFKVSSHDWKLVLKGKTRLGMKVDTVALALGEPLSQQVDEDYLSWIYNRTGERVEYIFFRGILDQVLTHHLDEFKPRGAQLAR